MKQKTTQALTRIELPGVPHVRSGKVREIFDAGDCYLFVATDRISAFDCVLPDGIPGKGHVLTQLSAFWFQRLAGLVDHHLVSMDPGAFPDLLGPFAEMLAGRSMLVRKAEMLPVECVARGYLSGSAWKEYTATGRVTGINLRDGYRQSERLAEPLFTPATKAESGHDINISYDEMVEIVGREVGEQLRDITLALYTEAAAHALEHGIIIADTKFEFGFVDGRLLLGDEVLTPDSSRFWPLEGYQAGRQPPSFDKQFVRDYLETLDWDKSPPAPGLPEDVIAKTRDKYLQAYRMLTGSELIE